MDVTGIQKQLRKLKIDGWLLYDFHGINPIAQRITGLEDRMITRRWFCYVPQEGDPRWIISQIEQGQFEGIEGKVETYAGWSALVDKLRETLGMAPRVAMEYAPHGAIPYVSRVDAGTIEMVRSLNVAVCSSADLVQWFEARWSAASLALHLEAAKHLQTALERAFDVVTQHLTAQRSITEYDVQQEIVRYFEVNGIVTDSAPIVASTKNTGDPHYQPGPERSSLIELEDLLLIDMWGKMDDPEAVYADITWMAYAGRSVPDDYARVFSVLRRARDMTIEFVKSAVARDEVIRGYQVDDVARSIITEQGFGDKFTHRTGHSLGVDVHGAGVNIDNLETHDERLIIPDIAFTVEPGIYMQPFGMRTEIDVYVGERKAEVTTVPVQKFVVPLIKDI
jgi:Xaa-Pro dipeptidase